MLIRVTTITVLVGVLAAAGMLDAKAQQPGGTWQQPVASSGWTFELTPYVWFASANADVNFNLPPALGGTVSANPSIGFGDLLSHTNLGFMGAAGARYDRFSVLTDILWLNVGGVASQFKSVNFPNHPAIPISGGVNSSQSLKMNTTIWTLAGGYTILRGDWGNLDAIAGFRYGGVSLRINYSLGISVMGPRGNGATFGGIGGVSASRDLWNAIGGFRGRIRIGQSAFFVPYYFDIGAGSSNLTWQIASGIGYQAGWADLSLTYRYLAFNQGSNTAVQNVSFQGPMLAANFRF